MDYKRFQDEFDKIKWYDSILEGADRCGTYDFCGFCDKAKENPCARAFDRAEKSKRAYVRIATVHIRKKRFKKRK